MRGWKWERRKCEMSQRLQCSDKSSHCKHYLPATSKPSGWSHSALLARTVHHLHNRTHLHTYIAHFTPTPHPHCPPTYIYTHSSLLMQHYWSHTVRGCNTIYIFHSHSSTSVCSQRRPIWQKHPAYLTLWTAHPTPAHPHPNPTVLQSTSHTL